MKYVSLPPKAINPGEVEEDYYNLTGNKASLTVYEPEDNSFIGLYDSRGFQIHRVSPSIGFNRN